MRHKLALTLAITVFLTVTASVIVEAAPLLNIGKGKVGINLGGNSTNLALPACADGIDNDGDGKVDLADPSCVSSLGTSEGTKSGGSGGSSGGSNSGSNKHGGRGVKRNHKSTVGKGSGGVGPHSQKVQKRATRNPDGSPTDANPTLSVADFGPAPLGVPNFLIDQFQIPPFLLPIYQACGTQYSIPWEVLAAINKIETNFGTNLNVSSAGAVGWMQFLPSTWEGYGVDANKDGKKDPFNPVDAICASARYLKAAGGDKDLRRGIFAYNHADWYVDEVLLYAKSFGKLPDDLIGSLTGLTEGAHFPVAAKARYADDLSEREAAARAKGHKGASGNAADVIRSSKTRRGINIYAKPNSPVVAVNDGVIKKLGHSKKLGNYIVLQDAYGNRYTYSGLGSIAKAYPVPKEKALTSKDFELVTPKADRKPNAPATAGLKRRAGLRTSQSDNEPRLRQRASRGGPVNAEDLRARLFALPQRPNNVEQAGLSGQLDSLLAAHLPGYTTFRGYLASVFQFNPKRDNLKPLRKGSTVVGGTVLGRIGKVDPNVAPNVHFEIKPAGKGAPSIDPKPILDGWKLLESTALYRAAGKNPLVGGLGVGQVLLMSKATLERRVLADPKIEIYSCGRNDIQTGQIDRRILATMEYLVARGYKLTITSLKCGHSFLTTSGNVSEHPSGNAMDIAAVNGIPIAGHQGRGTITEAVIKDLLKLQGPMRPHQIISLMDLGGPTFILPDHWDHIHVGFHPLYGNAKVGAQFSRLLKPAQWKRLIGRIAELPQPKVSRKPSKYSITVHRKRASHAHSGD